MRYGRIKRKEYLTWQLSASSHECLLIPWRGLNWLQAATQECEELKTLYKFYHERKISRNQLPQTLSMYKIVFPSGMLRIFNTARDRVVVPLSVCAELFNRGHLDCTRMKWKLRLIYWWSQLSESCHACSSPYARKHNCVVFESTINYWWTLDRHKYSNISIDNRVKTWVARKNYGKKHGQNCLL